jgi:hypothetical protein
MASGGTVAAQPPVELYRRVTPVEAATGLISVREVFASEVDVPVKCDDGSMQCETTRKFGRIWRLDFEVETQSRANGELLVEREARGTVHLALAATQEDEEGYGADLHRAFAELGASAFEEAYAGMHPGSEPFGGSVAGVSVEPSWSCFENGSLKTATQYSREVSVDRDGRTQATSTSSSSYSADEIASRLCSSLGGATAGAASEVLRTMSTPRVLVEDVLGVDVADLLPKQLRGDELLAFPENSRFSRKTTPGVDRSAGVSKHGNVVESRRTTNEVEVSARIVPAELALGAARENVWHSRWRLESLERRLGPLPEARILDSWSLTASLMPTWPPHDGDVEDPATARPEADAWYPVRLDPAALFAAVGESLEFRAEMSPAVLADAIVNKIEGLESAGWILVLCRDDTEATWGFAPTHGRARLLNGDAYCATVGSYLP